MLLRPEPCGVRPLGGTRGRTFGWEGGCSCAGWGAMLPPGCSIPTDCGETRTLASVWRVTSHAAGSDCLNCHGREPVPLRTRGCAACRAHVREVQHAGFKAEIEACCGIFKYVPKLL
jgi:hypothetical protein